MPALTPTQPFVMMRLGFGGNHAWTPRPHFFASFGAKGDFAAATAFFHKFCVIGFGSALKGFIKLCSAISRPDKSGS
jgi:hypothetical protein